MIHQSNQRPNMKYKDHCPRCEGKPGTVNPFNNPPSIICPVCGRKAETQPTTPGAFSVRLDFASADDLLRWTRYAADVAMTDGQPGAIKASLAAGALKRAKIKPIPEASIADFNAQADQADRESFAQLITMLEQALPGFKGCPAPDDWAKAALRQLIAQHAAMHAALKRAANHLPFIEGEAARDVLRSVDTIGIYEIREPLAGQETYRLMRGEYVVAGGSKEFCETRRAELINQASQ